MVSSSLAAASLTAWLWYVSALSLCLLFCTLPATGLASTLVDVTTGGSDRPSQYVLAGPLPNEKNENHREQAEPAMYEKTSREHFKTFPAMINALDVMQEQYFEVWQGIWPTGIDWTAAVLGTHISAALSTLSSSFDYFASSESTLSAAEKATENTINRYFSQLVASYFGQEAFRLRNEAYDDMLWVVLGWLESIKFIQLHSDLHYREPQRPVHKGTSKHSSWYGKQFIPGFAHRARLFWDLASKGWDTTLCDGGMIWSPYLLPYKNAITNELFISASISMYLYFPGDQNPAPFNAEMGPPVGPRDPKFLASAIEAYKWLQLSNMTDEKGLYTDGFHISGLERNPKNGTQKNTKCDSRNNMVYTYNQGVLLSGQRGLWEATGAQSYLEDGHKLISDVINATGYDLKRDKPYKEKIKMKHKEPELRKWHGVGRGGILEEACDAYGYCSQNGHTFKGIFFHHLTLFCAPFPSQFLEPGETFDVHTYQRIRSWHESTCDSYGGWIRHNAEAAWSTVTDNGKYGMWWGAPHGNLSYAPTPDIHLPPGAVDYRNRDVPSDRSWRGGQPPSQQQSTTGAHWGSSAASDLDGISPAAHKPRPRDVNDRGRGRTVETQSGGLAVMRALWEIVELRGQKANVDILPAEL